MPTFCGQNKSCVQAQSHGTSKYICLLWDTGASRIHQGFPDGSVGEESARNAGDPGSISDSGRSPGEEIGCSLQYSWASLVAQLVKNPPAMRETWVQPLVGKIPWRREWLPTTVFWPREFNGLYSPWGCKDSDSTEWLSLHFQFLEAWEVTR